MLYSLLKKKLFFRIIILAICIILLIDDISYDPYVKYYEMIGERIHKETTKQKPLEILSFLESKKNVKIVFFANCSYVEYRIFGKARRYDYSAQCIYSAISNLYQKDKTFLMLIEGYSNPPLSISYPGLKLDSCYYINKEKKAKVYLFRYKPNGELLPQKESNAPPVYSDFFENRTLEQTYKVWHAIKTGSPKNLSLESSNPIQGKISLLVDPSDCQDSICYFTNYNKFKRDNSDYLLSFSTQSTPQSTLGVYVGFWIRPPDNLISFQIYSEIQQDSALQKHHVIIPRQIAEKENYFSFFFSVSNGKMIIDDISLRKIPLKPVNL